MTKRIIALTTAGTLLLSGAAFAAAPADAGSEYVYGTATLTYAQFYAGDVSSTESYDAVSSATNSKYSILNSMYTDFVDETTNADGYHILGVTGVNVAVAADDLEAFQAANPTFTVSEEAPAQYKVVTMENGEPVYSATNFHVADTVTDATAELQTDTVWGDYQINVTDGAVVHLRNTREDEGFDIGAGIQGIILETQSGLKVGMEALQSIWVQPYEISFNISSVNSHNTHIAGYDNLPELDKLVGETVTSITYIMPDAAYVYQFEGIYIKPQYEGEAISASMEEGTITFSTDDFSAFENPSVTVTYTLGSGRQREVHSLLESVLETGTASYALNLEEVSALEDQTGVYSAVISSDNYADITVPLPMSQAQADALTALIADAQAKLAEAADETLEEHIAEAQELLDNAASSAEIGSIYTELNNLTNPQEENSGREGGHGSSEGGEGHSQEAANGGESNGGEGESSEGESGEGESHEGESSEEQH